MDLDRPPSLLKAAEYVAVVKMTGKCLPLAGSEKIMDNKRQSYGDAEGDPEEM